MELNDLVKLLEQSSDPRRQAIKQATAPKPTDVVNGTQIELPFTMPPGNIVHYVFPTSTATWTTTTTDDITTDSSTNVGIYNDGAVAY